MKYLLLFFTLLFFSSCSVPIPQDISHNDTYNQVLGKQYKLLKPLPIHADLVDDYKSKKILSYTITKFPGYGNRYVLWQKTLPKDTIVTIDKAMSYSNLLGSIFVLTVKTDNETFKMYNDAFVEIRSDLTIQTKDKQYIILNPMYFEEIK